jgi:acetyl-CoA C-acetyltransferase
MTESITIVGAARTPMGGFQGDLSGASATELGAVAIKAALSRAGIVPDDVDEVLMGCVLPAGLGQAPARQAAMGAGLPCSVPATTLNKMCGSGMKTAMLAYDQLRAGNGRVLVAGGMESMTNAPYLLPKARGGMRMGHGAVVDHMFLDGLEDAYDAGRAMGVFAEDCAAKFNFSREEQDAYALQSLANASKAQEDGSFDLEIAPVEIKQRKGTLTVTEDEQPKKARPDKIPLLKPAFIPDGTVTAANASSISDGAAALVLMNESDATSKDVAVQARILGHTSHAQEPGWFTTAPVSAINTLLENIGWTVDDVELWEINEAFAVVPMAAMVEIGIPRDKLNIHGGACALGHPIGTSGARIIVTLLHAMKSRNLKRGIAAICIGGGEGTAIAIERV